MAKTTRRAAPPAKDIRRRVHDLVEKSLTKGTISGAEVRTAVTAAMEDLRTAVAEALPKDREHVLHQAFDGMGDAVAAAIRSAEVGWRKTKAAGKRMTRSDVGSFVESMRSIESDFLDAVAETARGLKGESEKVLGDLAGRARKAGTQVGPAARSAIEVASAHGPELAVEAMKAGTRAAANVTGQIALGMSGLLSGFGTALRGASSLGESASAGRSVAGSGAAKATTKKTAKSAAKGPKSTTKGGGKAAGRSSTARRSGHR